MAMRIDAGQCSVCGACEFECPNGAVKMKGDNYIIDKGRCTSCEGQFDEPQCVEVCPTDCITAA